MQIKKIENKANIIMQERRSIRKYDPKVKISREEINNILQDAMTAPSSFNLQPWRFAVIDSEEGKQLIKPFMMFNELQWSTSSAIIALFGDMENVAYIDDILTADVEYGLKTPEHKEKMKAAISNYRSMFNREQTKNGLLLDCGFVGMQLMLSAKAYGYDTNPIGGYMKKELTEALGYDTERYIPVLLFSIGKAVETGADSTRFSVNEVTTWK